MPADVLEAGMAAYQTWRTARTRAIHAGSMPTMTVQTVTQRARVLRGDGGGRTPVEIVQVDRGSARPGGRRFGSLVHGVLASAPLDADDRVIGDLAASAGRALGATADEVAAAADRVRAAFADPLLARARLAANAGRCRREMPIAWTDEDGMLIEGVVDLAFEEETGWVVVDFKTDEAVESHPAVYRRQLALYGAAISRATGRDTTGVLVYL